MSLKAKIEAVIYASEEPVTLAQLTGLLGEEGQAELDALAAQQHSLALEDEQADDGDDIEPVEDADALNAETTDRTESDEESPATETGAPGLASETWEVSPTSPSDPPSAAEEAPTPNTKALAAEQKLAARELRDYFRSLLDELIADYANGNRGLEIREVAGGFRLATKPEYHDAVRGFVKSLKPPLKLTLQALETLAVVAYKQPVTAPEVSEIRGVDSAGVLGSLLARKLVTTAGRKQVIGRPILYKTTKDFLLRFGLKDINELPSIEEFEKMAGELNDAVQEEIPMEAHAAHTSAHELSEEASADPIELEASDEASADPIELEGHNLQPIEPDAPTSEPESIPEAETPSELEPSADLHSPQADGEPEDDSPEDPEA
jgi:segregation and condensation protein B